MASNSGGRCDMLVTLAKVVQDPPDVRVCEISNSAPDNSGLLHPFAHMVGGALRIEIYEVPTSIFQAIAAEGLASDYQREVS